MFVLNITDDYDPIYFECEPGFIGWVETTKFVLQAIYLFPGAILNALIIYTIWFKNRETYLSSSYFVIYSIDCLTNFISIFCDILARFFLYVTPLCPFFAPFFYEPTFFFKGVMIAMQHCKVTKFVIQTVLVFNRMTCVIYPNDYTRSWKKWMKYVIIGILLVPFSADWFLFLSRGYMIPTFGGFAMEYVRKIKWARQSRFNLAFLTIALSTTIICTTVTLYSLIMLPNRLVKFERLITMASAYISVAYFAFGGFQFFFAFFPTSFDPDVMYGISFLVYDVLTIGLPIIMLCVSGSLREHVLGIKAKNQDTRVFTSVNSVSHQSS